MTQRYKHKKLNRNQPAIFTIYAKNVQPGQKNRFMPETAY